MEELQTSDKWLKLIQESRNIELLDPDGWDRRNYKYSFFEEKITLEEFMSRLLRSTCQYKIKINKKS